MSEIGKVSNAFMMFAKEAPEQQKKLDGCCYEA